MLAPFWTDLDGTGAPGILADVLTDGVAAGSSSSGASTSSGRPPPAPFQVWIGVNGTQDISFAYDPDDLPTDPSGQAFLVGAENQIGGGEVVAVPADR